MPMNRSLEGTFTSRCSDMQQCLRCQPNDAVITLSAKLPFFAQERHAVTAHPALLTADTL